MSPSRVSFIFSCLEGGQDAMQKPSQSRLFNNDFAFPLELPLIFLKFFKK